MYVGITVQNKLSTAPLVYFTKTKFSSLGSTETIRPLKFSQRLLSNLSPVTLVDVLNIGLQTKKSGFANRATTTSQKRSARSINGELVSLKKSVSTNTNYILLNDSVSTRDILALFCLSLNQMVRLSRKKINFPNLLSLDLKKLRLQSERYIEEILRNPKRNLRRRLHHLVLFRGSIGV